MQVEHEGDRLDICLNEHVGASVAQVSLHGLVVYIQVQAWSKQPVLGIEPGPGNGYNQ